MVKGHVAGDLRPVNSLPNPSSMASTGGYFAVAGARGASTLVGRRIVKLSVTTE